MASMRDIKRRKESVQSTGQITKAMKLVSSVKLQKAKVGAELSKPYFDTMYETVADMIARSGGLSHPFLKKSESDKKAVIVITSNRGLAGGYNSNVVKLVTHDERFKKEDTIIYAVGTKGRDSLMRQGYEIAGDYSEAMNEPLRCMPICAPVSAFHAKFFHTLCHSELNLSHRCQYIFS